jgi:hypothetical protein
MAMRSVREEALDLLRGEENSVAHSRRSSLHVRAVTIVSGDAKNVAEQVSSDKRIQKCFRRRLEVYPRPSPPRDKEKILDDADRAYITNAWLLGSST